MDRLKHFIFVRHGNNWLLFFRFGLVGGFRRLRQHVVGIICKKLGPNENGIALDCR